MGPFLKVSFNTFNVHVQTVYDCGPWNIWPCWCCRPYVYLSPAVKPWFWRNGKYGPFCLILAAGNPYCFQYFSFWSLHRIPVSTRQHLINSFCLWKMTRRWPWKICYSRIVGQCSFWLLYHGLAFSIFKSALCVWYLIMQVIFGGEDGRGCTRVGQ